MDPPSPCLVHFSYTHVSVIKSGQSSKMDLEIKPSKIKPSEIVKAKTCSSQQR